ncbi:helix-turn-helix domain-containing protein [Oceanobacillus caeni]|uniref:helix-turn-helix domain-containing protein n=1 Tax=Oceanobacillus caeni TaxID=405946 RepID=UPI00363C5EF4
MLAKRLKYVRKLRKLSQEELGKRINSTKSTISNYENEYSSPSNEILKDLADVLDTTTDYLLGRSDDISEKPSLTEKDEKDIAKRMEKIKRDLIEGNAGGEGLSYRGEPMSPEAIDSLLEAIEHAERIATLANKKYTPKKYRDKE